MPGIVNFERVNAYKTENRKPMKKIIVTGGLGYIGSHTVVELVNRGYVPIIVDNLANSFPAVLVWLEEILGQSPLFYQIDCTDKEAFYTDRKSVV